MTTIKLLPVSLIIICYALLEGFTFSTAYTIHPDAMRNIPLPTKQIVNQPASTSFQSYNQPLLSQPRSSFSLPENTHVLVLPGFTLSSEEYTGEGSLIPGLLKRGWAPENLHVLPMKRLDWLQTVVHAATDIEFWKGNAAPDRPAYCWYLKRVADEIQKIDQQVKAEKGPNAKAKIIIMGHSAGGWLGRAAIGYGVASECTEGLEQSMCDCGLHIDMDNILGLVTIGSPNMPGPNGCMDVSGGALRITNEKFPGAFFSDKMFYVTLAAESCPGVEGDEKQVDHDHFPLPTATRAAHMPRFLAAQAYAMIGGLERLRSKGDGIVPVELAHLEGAKHVNVPDAIHARSLSLFGDWYGSEDLLDHWVPSVMAAASTRRVEA